LVGVASGHGLGGQRTLGAQTLHRLLGLGLAGDPERLARVVAVGQRKQGMSVNAVAMVVHRLDLCDLASRQDLEVAIASDHRIRREDVNAGREG
jgi:hypothetical protein